MKYQIIEIKAKGLNVANNKLDKALKRDKDLPDVYTHKLHSFIGVSECYGTESEKDDLMLLFTFLIELL